jgi:hypothetical protein
MSPRCRFTLFIAFVIVSLVTGCNGAATSTPTALPPSATSVPTLPPTDTPTPVPPTATNTPLPTATNTLVPPTDTPTPLPTATASSTPKSTLPPASRVPTKPPTAVLPTQPPSAPGIDLIAPKGKESCVNKFVAASYPWEDADGRGMYYWDKNWSEYPGYARPNIKFETVKALCSADKQCRGFTADFCVYVTGDAPSGAMHETVVTLIIASMFKNQTGVHILADNIKAKFTFQVK